MALTKEEVMLWQGLDALVDMTKDSPYLPVVAGAAHLRRLIRDRQDLTIDTRLEYVMLAYWKGLEQIETMSFDEVHDELDEVYTSLSST